MDSIENEIAVSTVDSNLPEAIEPERVDTSVVESSVQSSAPSLPDTYSPNYTVKAYEKEYEIPQNFRSFINKENEKEFKDVFEQVYALKTMKEKNVKIRAENENLTKFIQTQFEPLNKFAAKVGRFIQAEDFDSVMESLSIPIEKLEGWMLQRLQIKQLPLDQQNLYNKHTASQKQLYTVEQQAEAFREELDALRAERQQEQIDRRTRELDSAISSPEVRDIAEAYDSRVGQPGSFKLEVIQRGAFKASQGVDLSAEQAVKEVMQFMGLTTGTAQADPVYTGPKVVQRESGNPTLPNLAGKASSPASSQIKSLDDLKRLSLEAKMKMAESSY